jgi:hypothetical protein
MPPELLGLSVGSIGSRQASGMGGISSIDKRSNGLKSLGHITFARTCSVHAFHFRKHVNKGQTKRNHLFKFHVQIVFVRLKFGGDRGDFFVQTVK